MVTDEHMLNLIVLDVVWGDLTGVCSLSVGRAILSTDLDSLLDDSLYKTQVEEPREYHYIQVVLIIFEIVD